jgi:diguanylate cyclase (GGDEF)-like protein
MVGTCQDVTNDRELVEWLARRALHDPLTGVLNRSLIIDRLEHALARSSRLTTHTAVLFVDIDDFKRVNDDLGHAVGDEVLKTLALRMRSSVRSGDTVGRYGGDEFVVICEDLKNRSDALAVANRIVQAVDVAVPETGDVAVVTASIGLAVASGGDSAEHVIRNADIAMYRAKQRGRGLVEVFEEDGETV